MFLRVQRGAAVPISRQIEGQIRAQILSGTVAAEDQLPSVRQLARELAVNVNTVLRVYERLAADGLIELRHGDGTYVTAPGQGGHFGPIDPSPPRAGPGTGRIGPPRPDAGAVGGRTDSDGC